MAESEKKDAADTLTSFQQGDGPKPRSSSGLPHSSPLSPLSKQKNGVNSHPSNSDNTASTLQTSLDNKRKGRSYDQKLKLVRRFDDIDEKWNSREITSKAVATTLKRKACEELGLAYKTNRSSVYRWKSQLSFIETKVESGEGHKKRCPPAECISRAHSLYNTIDSSFNKQPALTKQLLDTFVDCRVSYTNF